jgi:hypothetical protein
MSGTPVMLKPLPLSVAEMSYTSIIKQFGLEDAPSEQRIQKLRAVGPEELVEKTPMSVPLLPFLDREILPELAIPPLPTLSDEIVPQRSTFTSLSSEDRESLPETRWCEELMIGDCQHDGNVFLFMGLAQRKFGIASALRASLSANLTTSAADFLLHAYKIHPTIEDDEAMKLIIDLATDIAYVAPALAYARSFSGKAYYYHFNEPNPWDGVFKGCSTHMLDAAFLFQNFNEHMSPEVQEVARDLAIDFVKFANGIKPWVAFDEGEGQARTYGPSDKQPSGIAKNNGWDNGRRDILWKLSEEGKVDLDSLSMAWDLFIAGR